VGLVAPIWGYDGRVRWLLLVLALAGCNAGGLAPADAPAGDDAPIDGAVVDGRGIDASRELVDADLFDAALLDAELHDANVIPDAEVHDAEPAPDAHDPLVDSLTVIPDGFSGTYAVTPAGTSCGANCQMYTTPTEVTITLTMLGGGSLSWGAGPCNSQGHQLTCTLLVDGEVIQPIDFYCPTFVIDVVNGSDDNPGTCGAPYKTITKAANRAVGFQIIRVLPGVYSDATETFPIVLPTGTPLWGKELEHGAGVVIETTGTSAVVCGNGSDIAGITVKATNGTAITSTVPCLVRDSVIHDSVTGIAVSAATRIERNTIRGNTIGVSITGAGVDLGTATSVGENDLTCNGVADAVVADGVTATAVGCLWDHAPPSGADVSLGAGATLDVSSNTLVSSPCL